MKQVSVKGIPLALFDNYVKNLVETTKKNHIFFQRWNSDYADYVKSGEFISDYTFSGVAHTLHSGGYKRQQSVSEIGDYSLKGDIISFWQPGFSDPIRLSYFGDELESIETYDFLTGRKLVQLNDVPIFAINEIDNPNEYQNIGVELKFAEFSESIYYPADTAAKADLELDFTTIGLFFKRFDLLTQEVEKYISAGMDVYIITRHKAELPGNLQKFVKRLPDKKLAELPIAQIAEIEIGFTSLKYKIAVITDREMFGTIFVSRRRQGVLKSTEAQKLLSNLEGEIEIGDFVVHESYGIGVYKGFTEERGQDYLHLEYAAGDELFVPLDQLHKLTKYIGDVKPEVTRLGKNLWQALKSRVKKQVAIAAKELARHYANVQLATGIKVSTKDSDLYNQFLAEFPYTPTSDQLRAESDIIKDLAKGKPMSRLLIGDVGYGKTEVAMRATFKIVEAGYQVVILCPTTVLALQHYRSFQTRFKKFPVTIGILSRINTSAENHKIIASLEEGKLDVVIATHRALVNDFKPKKLGLLVVDEEQRFGVRQKEKIRKFEEGIHTLFVSATPIPRTLSMALASIQDISLINTPPTGRQSINTLVSQFSWQKAVEAIDHEIERSGQVFFVHNEIKTIESVRAQLMKLMPNVRFVVAHGQMTPGSLDEIISDFYQHKYDCLIATTIIENGVDMPAVNTMIVNNAQNFGLAQMHQLRGRVGRGDTKAYAYFLFKGRGKTEQTDLLKNTDDEADSKKIKQNAKYLDRLDAIADASELGAGFKIASRDLEIRGAGNILGAEQHGNISKIGYGLYMQMLAEEIENVKKSED